MVTDELFHLQAQLTAAAVVADQNKEPVNKRGLIKLTNESTDQCVVSFQLYFSQRAFSVHCISQGYQVIAL